ncbi:MAG: hypothetical protein EBZ69_01135 [Alphaproteobacteria bacterium]|nr:hypothetical protein [Alphaproteobacteria bacterium]
MSFCWAGPAAACGWAGGKAPSIDGSIIPPCAGAACCGGGAAPAAACMGSTGGAAPCAAAAGSMPPPGGTTETFSNSAACAAKACLANANNSGFTMPMGYLRVCQIQLLSSTICT